MSTPTPPRRLSDYPLWRILVWLDDVERAVGASSPTVKVLAREVQRRLRGERRPDDRQPAVEIHHHE